MNDVLGDWLRMCSLPDGWFSHNALTRFGPKWRDDRAARRCVENCFRTAAEAAALAFLQVPARKLTEVRVELDETVLNNLSSRHRELVHFSGILATVLLRKKPPIGVRVPDTSDLADLLRTHTDRLATRDACEFIRFNVVYIAKLTGRLIQARELETSALDSIWDESPMNRYQQARHLMRIVHELHQRDCERVRIIPYIEDNPGGGTWRCFILPASSVTSEGDTSLVSNIEESGYFYTARGAKGYGRHPIFRTWSLADSAALLLKMCPALADAGCGPDEGYVAWYEDVLESTFPMGVIIERAWWDFFRKPKKDGWRTINTEPELFVSPPPT